MNISEWAKHNNMTPTEFRNEMYTTIASIGCMQIDELDDDTDTVVFKCNDEISDIEVYVRRVQKI